MKLGSIVKPKVDILYLTPENPNIAENIDEWPEWFSNQIGIVVSKNNDDILVMTSTARGTCFTNEVNVIC